MGFRFPTNRHLQDARHEYILQKMSALVFHNLSGAPLSALWRTHRT